MEDNSTDLDYDFLLPTQSPIIRAQYNVRASIRLVYLVTYSVTLLLGLPLNAGLLIVFLKNKPKKACRAQIMGLALSHIVLYSTITLYMVSAWKHFSWDFGKSLCKLGSYIIYANMFSCTTIITFWNLRWCVPRKCFTKNVSTIMVLLSWFMGAILAAPSLLSREIQYSDNGYACIDNYDYQKRTAPSEKARERELVVVFSRIVFGQLLPLVAIIINLCVKPRPNVNSERLESPVLCPVTIVHFLCWAPVLWLAMLQVKVRLNSDLFTFALPCATALSIFSSCIFPIICIWRGKRHFTQRSKTDSWVASKEEVNRSKSEEEHSLRTV